MALTDEDKQSYAADAKKLLENALLMQLIDKLQLEYYNAMKGTLISEHHKRLEIKLKANAIDDLLHQINKTIENAIKPKDFEALQPRQIY